MVSIGTISSTVCDKGTSDDVEMLGFILCRSLTAAKALKCNERLRNAINSIQWYTAQVPASLNYKSFH